MPYLGNTPTTQNFISGTDYFNGTGSQTAFTLTRTVNSVNDIQVVVNNVVQQPNDAYTLSGTTLTFTSAPSSGTNNVYVRYLSTTLQSITPSYGSIIPSMLNPPNTIYWNTSGNVGIGTISPTDTAGFSRALDLNGSAGAAYYARTNGSATSWTVFGNYGVDGYINNRGAGTLQFYNNNAERMRIDSSGNVLIGTTSAATSSTLNVVGAGYQPIYVNTTISGGGGAAFSRSGTQAMYVGTGGSSWLTGSSTADGLMRSEANMLFAVGNTERMRIDSSGNFLVGTTTDITSGGTAAARACFDSGSNQNGMKIKTNNVYYATIVTTTSAANHYPMYMNNSSGGNVGYIFSDNTTTSYVTSSDYRLKENIAPMTGALVKVAQLKPCTYTWKASGSSGQGFIAHELQAVVPECVTGEKDAVETYTDEEGNEQTRIKPQGVDTSFLVATLTAAIQEQQAMIEELKARIETLEAK